LKEHPLNEKLYPADKHDHQIALLGEKMDEEYISENEIGLRIGCFVDHRDLKGL